MKYSARNQEVTKQNETTVQNMTFVCKVQCEKSKIDEVDGNNFTEYKLAFKRKSSIFAVVQLKKEDPMINLQVGLSRVKLNSAWVKLCKEAWD